MSKLLGGAQYVLTGNFGHTLYVKCHLLPGAFGPLSDAQGWWLSLQLLGPHGGPGSACTTALQGLSWQLGVT